MKKQNNANKGLQEKLGQYEFQLPDSNWKNMEAILDGHQPVPKPPKPPAPWWTLGSKWGLSTLFSMGLVVIVLASGTFTIYHFYNDQPEVELSSFLVSIDETTVEAQQAASLSEEVNGKALYNTPPTSANNKNLAQASLAPSAYKQDEYAQEANAIDTKDSKTSAVNASPKVNASNTHNTLSDSGLSLERESVKEKNKRDTGGKKAAGSLSKQPEEELLSNSASMDKKRDAQKEGINEDISAPLEENNQTLLKAINPVMTLSPHLLSIPAPEFEQEITPLKSGKKFNLGVKGGVDFGTGVNSYLLGLHFAYDIDKRWAIEAGVQYKERSVVNQDGIVAVNTDTVFWPDLIEASYSKDSVRHLHFMEFPVILTYKFKPKLRVFAGGQLTLTNNSAWRETLYRQFENGSTGSGGSSSGGYFSPGIVRWSTDLIVGGEYRFNRKFGLDIRYVQGVTDLTYDEYFGNNDNYLNSSLQLTLKWYWR